MMVKLKTIGVIGGMGPEATTFFMQRMINAVDASDDSDHIPLLVDNNTQIPSRIKFIVGGAGADPTTALIRSAQNLELLGVAALAMPCNTAHFFSRRLTESVHVPLVNMVELAVSETLGRLGPGSRIGVLGSPALRLAGVYDEALKNNRQIPIYPSDEQELLSVVNDLKCGKPKDQAAKRLTVLGNDLIADGAELLLVCCSEFSICSDAIGCGVPIIDTLDLLVSSCVEFSKGQIAE